MIALISEQQPVDVITILNLALGASTRGGLGKPVRGPGLDPAPVHHMSILSPAMTIRTQCPTLQ